MLKGPKIHRSLLKKGFAEDRNRKDIFYYFYYNGKKTQIWTKMSHNPGDLDDWHIKKMSDQTNLTKDEFIAMTQCSLKKEDLLKIYLERKIIY